MVIYEWADVQLLGKETTTNMEEDLPVSLNLSSIHLDYLRRHSRKHTFAHQVPCRLVIVHLTNWDDSFSTFHPESLRTQPASGRLASPYRQTKPQRRLRHRHFGITPTATPHPPVTTILHRGAGTPNLAFWMDDNSPKCLVMEY